MHELVIRIIFMLMMQGRKKKEERIEQKYGKNQPRNVIK
jgi:hypothetical protein